MALVPGRALEEVVGAIAVYSMLAQSAFRAMALMGRGQERRSTPGTAQGKAEIVYYSTLGKELSVISPVSYSN